MFDLKGRVAAVSGASSGLGQQMARAFARQGADLAIMARRVERLEAFKKELEKEYKVKVIAIKCDVTNTEEINAAAKAVEKEFGKVDILLNCAGSAKNNDTLNMTDEEWDFTIATDETSVFKMTRAFGNVMKKKGYGRIINIASTNGINTYYPDTLAYDASKAALISLTHNLAIKFSPYVNVNAVAPGFIGTDAELKDYDAEFLKEEQEKILVKRYGKASEVAELVYFLASEKANFINNTVIRIDGGQLFS